MTASTQEKAKCMKYIEQASNFDALANPHQSIGNILVTSGRLTREAAEKIRAKQLENNALFGENGVAMGLITPEDLEYAIARQFEYAVLKKGDSVISEDLVSAYEPFGPSAEAIRELRTHLLLSWFETESKPKTLSVLSAQRAEGKSFIAANLAVSFSQLGHRTLLLDADFRHSKQHQYFGISNRQGLSSLLQGRGTGTFINPVTDIPKLSLLTAGPLAPNPQELLSQTGFSKLLNELASHFDLIILDTPAALLYSDAAAIASRTSASIVVVRQGCSKVEQLRQLRERMLHTGANLLGSVLLDF